MRILVITDSLSLPRVHDEGVVQWEEGYVNRLRKAFPETDFIQLAIGGATIEDLYNQLNYYKVIKPDAVLMQCGIVDCAPRALTRLELQLVKKFHLFRLINPLTKALRRMRNIAYTSPRTFETAVKKLTAAFPECPVFAIGILPVRPAYETQVPGILKRVQQYNDILQRHTRFIEMSDMPLSGIAGDHHHLNAEGHLFLFQRLSQIITDLRQRG